MAHTQLYRKANVYIATISSMNKIIVTSVNQNLARAISLLDAIDSTVYQNSSVAPYYSSIGSHLRHCLDFFDCIVNGLDNNQIDLTARKRDERIAMDRTAAKSKIYELQQTFTSYLDTDTNYILHVTDDLGTGKAEVSYTLESILAYANSHATHHYAIIGMLLYQLNVEVEIPGFGYNPSTPKTKKA